jgi:hypothetical protein
MNIHIKCMSRDGANYRQFSYVIISNKSGSTFEGIKKKIRSSLIDGEYFSLKHGVYLVYINMKMVSK